ncbi:MAG: hypothetical protein JNJ54_14045 [Myxococcaceae bacterium]|nr:hypothetical protein [Myxococcaceae bacterium]
MAENDLQKRLEKLGEQLVSDIEAWEKRTRGERAKVLDHLAHTLEGKLGQALGKIAEETEKHREREERRERRREEQRRQREARQRPSTAGGIVFLLAAVICAVMGIMNPQLWWMVFVALGLGLAGAGQLAGAARHKRELGAAKAETTAEAQTLAAPRAHEVDVLCDQLLTDLAAAPEAVRAFVTDPQKTVSSMRTTLKSLDLRRQQLLTEDAKGRLEAATKQRAELTARHDAATDPETKLRMEEALRSMAAQEDALRQLHVMTERVDGEYTSLLVHLQELRTRVSVAKSSSSSVQLQGLRSSVQRLNDELGAISEAMDAVRRGDVTPVSEVGSEPGRAADRTRVSDGGA